MKHHTLDVWLLDYDVDTGELEFHLCDKSGWNGVAVTAADAQKMKDEFMVTGRTCWTGQKSSIDFVRGPNPDGLAYAPSIILTQQDLRAAYLARACNCTEMLTSWKSDDERIEWRVTVSGGGDTGIRQACFVHLRVGRFKVTYGEIASVAAGDTLTYHCDLDDILDAAKLLDAVRQADAEFRRRSVT